ncbi:MAG: hemerythrin domain-containing protein [Myxococcota bacterium]|nr:hemerythrin domain-containing protein [Myxococcota bacterium]
MENSRRRFLSSSTMLGASVLLGACKPAARSDVSAGGCPADAPTGSTGNAMEEGERSESAEEEVTATEDLMREHGVLRRALVVYRETAARLFANAGSVPPDTLQKTAKLFKEFGEDYHERKLEEAFVFPAVKKAGGAAARDADTLLLQHNRGREMTDYVLAVTQAPKIGANAQTLAAVLLAFARMYEPHAAVEDTVVFPAWKKTLSSKQLDEMGDKFEEIERATFGKDGFEDAARRMTSIEATLGLSDLSTFTAAAPPRAT